MTPANITIAFTLILNAILIQLNAVEWMRLEKNVEEWMEEMDGAECRRGDEWMSIGEWRSGAEYRRLDESG